MAFKPKNSNTGGGSSNIDWEIIQKQLEDQLEEGLILGVVSGLVDLGTQKRDPIKDEKTGEEKERKDAQEVAVFIDIPEVIIDWDLAAKNKDDDDFVSIGKKPYRLMVNPEFKGDVRGISFNPAPPIDGDGNVIETSTPWTFAANSVLTKLAKATKCKEVIDGDSEYNMDLSRLLGKPLMVNIEIKEGKNGGIFPKMASYNAAKAKDLKGVDTDIVKPFIVDFDDPDPEAVEQLRFSVKNKISRAINFEGSAIEKVFKEQGFEPRGSNNNTTEKPNTDDEPPKTKGSKKSESKPQDDYDDDIPF